MSSNISSKKMINNPYLKKRPPLAPLTMGRQSQQRNTLKKRTYQLAALSNNKKQRPTSNQRTLDGGFAFDSSRDCEVCRAQALKFINSTYRVPKRAHNELCAKNKKTQGKGTLSTGEQARMAEEKRLLAALAPLEEHEKGSLVHLMVANKTAFFKPRITTKPLAKMTSPKESAGGNNKGDPPITGDQFCHAVASMVTNVDFCEKHKGKGAPLAMVAFANEVCEKIIRNDSLFQHHFSGLTITVSPAESNNNPQYHSIVGQRLLYVDWQRAFGLELSCPDQRCTGKLCNTRTNFSKNKVLFPIYTLDGAPAWCVVMTMECNCCKRKFVSNESDVLLEVPPHYSFHYPVDIKYALGRRNCHLAKLATQVFDSIMVTYGNGDLCSRLLYQAINTNYLERVEAYVSALKQQPNSTEKEPYVEKDGVFIKQHPPLGETIRDMYDEAASSTNNRWRISNHDRNTREIQGVQCDGGIFAQDHTFDLVKNYQKSCGAKALWDAATSTGEIAVAILVPTTTSKHLSHAAIQLSRRDKFNPRVMYSDTWPNKDDFWYGFFPGIEGRLGLFHFEKRITATLRKKHVDFHDALSGLLNCLYSYHADDYELLLSSLKDGSLSATGKKYTSHEISDLQGTKLFRDRYNKCLRKQLRAPETMVQMLDEWFCRYKITSSDPTSRPAGGRLDPVRNIALFTSETKEAVERCKEKAKHLTDPLPVQDMYDEIPPNPKATHPLSEYLSKRGESKLESFHDRLAHFANTGMRNSLADNLNLTGTARYNLQIRHKHSLMPGSPSAISMELRKRMPSGYDKIPPYFNHSELWYINNMAAAVGIKAPFPYAERLPNDTGERFFSEYLTVNKPTMQKYNELDFCLCSLCTVLSVNLQKPAAALPNVSKPNVASLSTTIPSQSMPSTNHTNTNTSMPSITMPPPPPPLPWYQPILPQLPPQPPMLPLPFYFLPQSVEPVHCCRRYASWCTRRLGRPPHDDWCWRKRGRC